MGTKQFALLTVLAYWAQTTEQPTIRNKKAAIFATIIFIENISTSESMNSSSQPKLASSNHLGLYCQN